MYTPSIQLLQHLQHLQHQCQHCLRNNLLSYQLRYQLNHVNIYIAAMASNRVKSKNLFNFKPQGFVDPDIVAFSEKMKVEYNMDIVAWSEGLADQTEEEYVAGMRAMMEGPMAEEIYNIPMLIEVRHHVHPDYGFSRLYGCIVVLIVWNVLHSNSTRPMGRATTAS